MGNTCILVRRVYGDDETIAKKATDSGSRLSCGYDTFAYGELNQVGFAVYV